MYTLNKHDSHLENLVQRIRISDEHDIIYTNYPLFSERKRRIGEIDILAISGDRVDVFEVKCSPRKTKATKQLHTIKKHLGKHLPGKTVQTFFYCGSTGLLQLVM